MKRLYSVLIPVYNTKKFLDYSLDSVKNQTYCNFEVIIINDGSTDGSGDYCEEYVKNDSRFKIFHQVNKGLLITRGNLVNKASGDFVLFLDSDDYWDLDLLEEINKTIDNENCDMIIYGFKIILKNKIKLNPPEFNDINIFDKNNKNKYILKWLEASSLNSLCRKAVRKDLIDSIDYTQLDNILNGEDLLQSIILIHNANKIVFLKKALYNYRNNHQSITTTFNIKKFDDFVPIKNSILDLLKKMNIYNEENLKCFYTMHFKNLLFLYSQLINSSNNKNNSINIIKNVQNRDEWKEAMFYISLEKLKLKSQFKYLLLINERYNAFYTYIWMLVKIKKLFSYIFRKIML